MNLGLWQYRLRACCGLRFTVKVKASIGGFLRHGGEAGFIGMSDIRTSRLFIELWQNSSRYHSNQISTTASIRAV